MITGTLKSKIDKLWEEFWTGGITNPLTVIEQITFLMYARLLDMNETSDEKRSQRTKKEFNRRFNDKRRTIPVLQTKRPKPRRHLICRVHERRPAYGAKTLPIGKSHRNGQ